MDLAAYEGMRPLRTLDGAALIDPTRAEVAGGEASGKADGELLATSDVIEPGSVVRVVNTESGQSVLLRIDQRADDAAEPAHIRLSPEAALQIGMTDTRPMLVRIEVLAGPSGRR